MLGASLWTWRSGGKPQQQLATAAAAAAVAPAAAGAAARRSSARLPVLLMYTPVRRAPPGRSDAPRTLPSARSGERLARCRTCILCACVRPLPSWDWRQRAQAHAAGRRERPGAVRRARGRRLCSRNASAPAVLRAGAHVLLCAGPDVCGHALPGLDRAVGRFAVHLLLAHRIRRAGAHRCVASPRVALTRAPSALRPARDALRRRNQLRPGTEPAVQPAPHFEKV